MPKTEIFESEGRVLVYVVRGESEPQETTFVTPNEANMQVGFVVKGPGDVVPRHYHYPVEREIVGTAEVLIVRQGSGELEIYNEQRDLTAKTRFGRGDIIVLLHGGHGFTFDERTVLLEVKQGPYPGVDEKERF